MNFSENQIDFVKNQGKIVKIFESVSTINVFLQSHDQNNFIKSLQEIFKFDQHAFIIFNFFNHGHYKFCKYFENDLTRKISYYKRKYQNTREPQVIEDNLQYLEGFRVMKQLMQEDSVELDSQKTTRPDKLHGQRADRWYNFMESGYFISCSFETLQLYLGCLVRRTGSYLFIVEETPLTENKLEDLSELLKKTFERSQNLKIFVSMFNELYVLNPFIIDKTKKSFGVLEKLTDEGVKMNLKNLHNFPLRVEIFESAYSIQRASNSSDFSGKLDLFLGPDVKVARFIENQMNASSNQSAKLIKFLNYIIFSSFASDCC